MSRLGAIEIDDLKNTPCILVASHAAREEEREYYEKIVGVKCDFVFF